MFDHSHHDHGHAHDAHEHEPHKDLPGVPQDQAQKSLVDALRSSFNMLRWAMIALVVWYAFSGVFIVPSGYSGLISRFGKLREFLAGRPGPHVFKPGPQMALPDPFDKKIQLPGSTRSVTVTTFLVASESADAAIRSLEDLVVDSRDLTPGVDGAMLTGDRNLSHGRWKVDYTIADPEKFVTNLGETPEAGDELLKRCLESAVVREVSGRTVEEVTRTARNEVRDGVHARLQAALDRLGAGLRVDQVIADTIEPGGEVHYAFQEVDKKESERSKLLSDAREVAARTLSEAAGESGPRLLELIREYGALQLEGTPEQLAAARLKIDQALEAAQGANAGRVSVLLSEADGKAQADLRRLEAQYEEFTNLLKKRAVQPRLTLLKQWVAMREAVLGSKDNWIYQLPSGASIIDIYANRDPKQIYESEKEEIEQRTR